MENASNMSDNDKNSNVDEHEQNEAINHNESTVNNQEKMVREEWIRSSPQEVLLEIFAHVDPGTVVRCRLVSKYWRTIFTSDGVFPWKLMCEQYNVPSIYFKSETDYYSLFLSRYAVCFLSEKNAIYYKDQYEEQDIETPLRSVEVIPGLPAVVIGRFYMQSFLEENTIKRDLANYELYFKDKRVHPNLAVQRIYTIQENWEVLACFEKTDDYLTNLLITRPDLVTEANICDVIKQILSALAWLKDRAIYTPHLKLENFRANVTPDNKLEIKIHSALLDFSRKQMMGSLIPDQLPSEVLCQGGQACTEYSYSWMVGWLTFTLLTGRNPFASKNLSLILHAINDAKYTFSDITDSHVTPLARDFISKLLVKEQSARMSITDALKHEWIQSPNKSHEPMLGVIGGYREKYGHFVRNE